MTVPTDLERCVGWYTCNASGYDAINNRLLDKSGLGFHLPISSGTPTYATRSGVDCIDFLNTNWFEGPNPIPIEGSIVCKFHTDAAGSPTGVLELCTFRLTDFGAGDHVALTPLTPWENFDARTLNFSASATTINLSSRNTAPPNIPVTFTRNVWGVVTGVWNGKTQQGKLRLGSGTPATSTLASYDPDPPGIDPTVWMQSNEDTMRFGYLKPSGGLTAPQHFSVAEIAFFHDDILLNQAAAAAALVASWS